MLNYSYGILPPGDCYNDKNPIRLLRATDMQENFKVDIKSALKVPYEYYLYNRSVVKNGDILIAVKGATIASDKSICYIENLEEKTIINGSIFKFNTNNKTNYKYVSYCLSLDFVKKQMKYELIANNAVDYLDKNLIKNLLIPIPSELIQKQVIEIMDKAYKEKQQKENEAEQLIESINNYLLNELGILLSEEEENNIENRIFYVNSNNVLGSRFDPRKYTNKYKKLNLAIENSPYKNKPLKEIVINNISGNWGMDEDFFK